MSQEVVNKYLFGTAIIAVPNEKVEGIINNKHRCVIGYAQLTEDTHVFMHRFFEVLKKKQITHSSRICLIIHIPQKRSITKEEFSELNDFICFWNGSFDIFWGMYKTTSIKKMRITILTNLKSNKK